MKILIIAGSPLLGLLREGARAEGLEAACAKTFPEARRLIQSGEEYDAIVCVDKIAGLSRFDDGIAFLRVLREIEQDRTPVTFLLKEPADDGLTRELEELQAAPYWLHGGEGNLWDILAESAPPAPRDKPI